MYIARQEIEEFTHFIKTYISSAKDAELSQVEILDTLSLLSWNIHRFRICLVTHLFPATKLLAETTYPQLLNITHYQKHYTTILSQFLFLQNFITISEVPTEVLQKFKIDRNKIEIKNQNVENQTLTVKNVPENTKTSLEASPIKNVVHHSTFTSNGLQFKRNHRS